MDIRSMRDLIDFLGIHLPEATVGEDNEGQIVIYTNLKSVGDEDADLISMGE